MVDVVDNDTIIAYYVDYINKDIFNIYKIIEKLLHKSTQCGNI